jgi:hypothetical protein
VPSKAENVTPNTNSLVAAQTPSTAPKVGGKTPESLTMSSEELTKECVKDGKAADKKYADKVLLVEGAVLKSKKSGRDWSVQLFGFKEAGTADDKFVDCEFSQKSPSFASLSKLVPGQNVKIKGTFVAVFPYGPRIGDCELIETGPDTAIRITAEQLTKEYATNDKAADAKYKGKQLVVEGVVAVQPAQENTNTVLLEGFNPDAEKPKRVAVFSVRLEKEFRALKKGQKVKVRGEGHGTTGPGVDLWAESVELLP